MGGISLLIAPTFIIMSIHPSAKTVATSANRDHGAKRTCCKHKEARLLSASFRCKDFSCGLRRRGRHPDDGPGQDHLQQFKHLKTTRGNTASHTASIELRPAGWESDDKTQTPGTLRHKIQRQSSVGCKVILVFCIANVRSEQALETDLALHQAEAWIGS